MRREATQEGDRLVADEERLLVAWIGSHSETELSQTMGVGYTEGTVGLCEDYLRRFG